MSTRFCDALFVCVYIYIYVYNIYTVYTYIYIYTYTKDHFYPEDADSPRHVFMTMTESVWTDFGPVPFVIETFRLSLILGESPQKHFVNWRFPATSHLAPLHLSLSLGGNKFRSVRAAFLRRGCG